MSDEQGIEKFPLPTAEPGPPKKTPTTSPRGFSQSDIDRHAIQEFGKILGSMQAAITQMRCDMTASLGAVDERLAHVESLCMELIETMRDLFTVR